MNSSPAISKDSHSNALSRFAAKVRPDRYDKIAIAMIIILGIVLHAILFQFPEFKAFSQGDAYLDANQYIPGKNFAERGFIANRFLPDYAVGPDEYHPLWYTHNPPLSEIMNGVYQKLGVKQLFHQRIIAIIWNLLGAFFFYLLLKRLISPLVAILGLAVLVSNPEYLYYGDNLFTNMQWFFIFGSMFFFVEAGSSEGAQRKRGIYLGVAGLLFFLLCYSNYEYVPFTALFFIGLKLLKIKDTTWKHVFVVLGVGIVSFIIHQATVIWAIGPRWYLLDITESMLHRLNLGATELNRIYEQIPVLMWDPRSGLPYNNQILVYWRHFFIHLESYFGFGWSLLLIVMCLPRHILLPGDPQTRKRLLRIVLMFFVMSSFWFVVFMNHTASHRWGSTILVFQPFSALIFGLAMAGVYQNFIKGRLLKGQLDYRKHLMSLCVGAVLLALLVTGLTSGRIYSFRPFQAYPGIEVLPKYKGKYLMSNAIPTLISYYTNTPTGWSAEPNDVKKGHVPFLVNPKYRDTLEPEYFFSTQHPVDPEFWLDIDEWFSARYQIADAGTYFTIYNMREPIPGVSVKKIDLKRLHQIRNDLPKATKVILIQSEEPAIPEEVNQEGTRKQLADWIAQKVIEITGMTEIMESMSVQGKVVPLSNNLFLKRYKLTASSINKPGQDPPALTDNNPASFWHVLEDKVGEVAWVKIDFGPHNEKIINLIRVRPRSDIKRQFFRTALIQGSQDDNTWEDIAAILQNQVPVTDAWLDWYFMNDTTYRFYRFLILDGHEGGCFWSMGELQMYLVSDNILPISADVPVAEKAEDESIVGRRNLISPKTALSVSSQNEPWEGPDKLLDEDANTFWHVSLKQIGEPAWVIVDFGEESKKRISYLGARPRSDMLHQFFRKAVLFGSDDKVTWEPIAWINQESAPSDDGWIIWSFDNSDKFRYYKLHILQGHEDGEQHHFYSLAELAMYE